jgi:hypothetical protein
MIFEACREYTKEAFISVGPLLMNACDGLHDVVTDVLPGLVAVVLGEKSGFPSAWLVDTGMLMVSVLTGQHSWWGGVKLKSSMGSTDISVSFADRIKKMMVEAKENKAEEEGDEGDEEGEGEKVGGWGGKEGSQIEVEEGRGNRRRWETKVGLQRRGSRK